MTKAELVQAVAEASGETEGTVECVLKETIDTITSTLGEGTNVDLHPLGRFVLAEEAAHTGTNPSTHEPLDIPAKTRVLFHPAQDVKDAVNAAPEDE
jgi:DNA-binding protein HU-beta